MSERKRKIAGAASTKPEVTDSQVSDQVYDLPINEMDGVDAEHLFSKVARGFGFTFDDIILLPGFINFSVAEVDLSVKVTKNGPKLNAPFVSSPMDTVTEHKMAIAMAMEGGLGIIHGNLSVEHQCDEVRKVKRFESGFIVDPVCLRETNTIADVDKIKQDLGFTAIPITTEDGTLVGLVTSRDIDFLEDRTQKLSAVMTKRADLITLKVGCTLEEANNKLKESKKGRLPVVDAQFKLQSLVSRKDLNKNQDWPIASKDHVTKQLLVGACVLIEKDDGLTLLESLRRVDALTQAGADVFAFEGDHLQQVTLLKLAKAKYPHMQVICGNVATAAQVKLLCEAGADGLRIGVGVGSIATGQLVKAVGRAQMSAVHAAARVAKEYGVPVIADGGVGNSGCAIKALCLGASMVMMGSLLAGTEESPGSYHFQDGMRVKAYRGMMSRDVLNQQQKKREFVIPQGVSGAVVDKGSVHKFIPYQAQSIRHGLQDIGAVSIAALHDQLYSGKLRFELRSPAAQKEGGVHDLHSWKPSLLS
ncbi:inosine-5'-monophosphate dehydrogenase [Batrachochytrium salamandrivorans]|nr:inosine-5'-monophosphate dehydrogenase [Batrachochytrium salamandrivorans]